MFFRNGAFLLFVKYLWVGLIFGVASIILKLIAKLFKKNVLVVNVLTFVFWLSIGVIYQLFCIKYNNFAFFGAGLVAIVCGILIIKISIDFFFDYFLRFVYNEIKLKREKSSNGKLQTDKKV